MAARLAERLVEPELLDALPADHPAARGARRDLVLVNRLMFNAGILAAELARHAPAGRLRIAELGAGDGRLMRTVAGRLAGRFDRVAVTLVDIAGPGADAAAQDTAFRALGWKVDRVTADVFDWMKADHQTGFDVITANLFLHHFRAAELRRLLGLAGALTRLFVAVEPRRDLLSLAASRCLGALGANRVTRHDAPVSVRAGFRDGEISACWADQAGFRLAERSRPPFAHVFVAKARDRAGR